MNEGVAPAIEAALGRAFPFRVGGVTGELIESSMHDDRLLVTVRLVRFDDDGQLVDVKEQAVDLGAADADLIERLVIAARRRLEERTGCADGLMPDDLLREHVPYVPVGPFESEGALWHQDVCVAIDAQAKARGFEERHRVLDDWSSAPRTVYHLWLAECMLGGNGIGVFLLQQDLEDVVGVLEALDAADCRQLAALYRQGIGLCADQGSAEFLDFVDDDWLEEQRRPHTTTDAADPWTAIDHWEPGGSYRLLEEELGPALRRTIDANRSTLLR